MKWLRQEGRTNFEKCLELIIDIENQTFTFENYYNHPMGGGGNVQTYTFEEAATEKFQRVIEFYGDNDFDKIFGDGANEEFKRILKMSKAEYDAEDLENKEILIDLSF